MNFEACKAQEQLFFAHVAETDGGLHVVAHAFHPKHITNAEALVFDDLPCLQTTIGWKNV